MPKKHFIELTDGNGNAIRVNATAVVQYICDGCNFLFFTLTNHGHLKCPLCNTQFLTPTWMRPQLAFIPERPSDFDGGMLEDEDA